ncbi:MAG TPA: SPFH domain-containing protein, partial [Verrucomicrobiota bacterium]|nr:SPFH domain-containing protein [Verrucomicrobiota bacterium]
MRKLGPGRLVAVSALPEVVGAEANYCWNCKGALHPESRQALASGVWQREPGCFARRIEVAEVRRLLEKGLHIEIGTVALLVEGGKIKAVLGPGRHTLETLGRKLVGLFATPAPQTVILAEAGDVVLPLRFSGLRTKEELAVEGYTEVCFRFVPERGEAFLANVLKGQGQLSYEGLADWMRQEIRGAVADLAQSATIEDLVKDPQRRLRIEDSLRQALAAALERGGV